MTDPAKTAALEFVRANPVCHLATVENNAPYTRVMHAFRVDDDFAVWFCSGASSNKVRQIRKLPKVCVTFWQGGRDLRVLGSAEVVADPQVRRDVWQEGWASFFAKGADDPEYCVLKVTAEAVEFRDAEKHGHETQRVV